MQKENNITAGRDLTGLSFSKRLDALSREAYAAVKTRLASLSGHKFVLKEHITLHVDTCSGLGCTYRLNAGTVLLTGDEIQVFAKGFDLARLKEPFGWDNLEPTEYWGEGSLWTVGCGDLFRLFDEILKEQETQTEP